MAVPKTQIRVEQLTGSIPDDQVAAAAADVLVLTSLSGTLNHIASSLYRIHGADTFSENATGVIKFADNAASAFAFKEAGNAYLEFVSTNSSEAVKISKTLDVDGNLDVDNTTTTIDSSGGISLDAAAASNLTTSSGALTLTSAAAATWSTAAGALVIDGAGGLTLDSDGTDAVNLGTEASAKTITIGNDASAKVDVNALIVELDSAGTIVLNSTTTTTLDSTQGMSLDAGAASNFSTSAGALTLTSAAAATWSTAAGALTIDAAAAGLVLDGHTGVDIDASNSGKVSIDGAGGIDIGVAADVAIDVDASTLDIDTSSNITIDASGGSISVGTNSNGRAINLGHTTSLVTVNDNLTVTGDLTVQGTTTTVDVEVISTANGVIFEGATNDSNETTLKAVDPTGSDKTHQLANVSGFLIPFAVVSTTTITSTPEELNLLDGVAGLVQADLTKLAAVDATAAELNIMDGGTSATATTLVDADRAVINDNGTMVQVAMSDFKNYLGGSRSKHLGQVGIASGGVTPTGGSADAHPIVQAAGVDIAGLAITMGGPLAVSDDNVDVFLNGQLLLSGTAANVAAVPAAADYSVVDTNSLKFGFQLEQGDIITVITEQ